MEGFSIEGDSVGGDLLINPTGFVVARLIACCLPPAFQFTALFIAKPMSI